MWQSLGWCWSNNWYRTDRVFIGRNRPWEFLYCKDSFFRFEPDVDETDLDMRLHFTTNTATQGTGLTNFNIEKQALVMTVGAAVTYTSETLISFFVGDTLYGDTKADAGSFRIEVNATTDGTLEILGVTVMTDI